MPLLRTPEAELRPHQNSIMQTLQKAADTDRIALIYGGRGTFKTSTWVWWLFRHLWTISHYYTGIRIGIAAQSYDQLRETFVETWIEQAPFQDQLWRWDSNRKRIQLIGMSAKSGAPFDTELVLRHAGDAKEGAASMRAAAARRGANLSGYVLVQAESMSAVFAREIEVQTRRQPVPRVQNPPPCNVRIMDANPGGADHWLHRRALDPNSPTYEGQRFCVMGVATTAETSVYSQDRIDSMRTAMPPDQASRELDAQWVGNVGSMFPLADDHVNDDPPPQSGRWFLTFDYGYDPDPFVALLCCSAGPWLWIVDEVKVNRKLQGEQLLLIRRMLKDRGNPELAGVTGDPSGRYSEDNRPRYRGNQWWSDQLGVPRIGTSNSRASGWAALIRLLLTDEQNRPRLTFHSRCEYLLSALRGMRWAETQARHEDSDIQCDDHGPDALRYMVMSKAMRRKE